MINIDALERDLAAKTDAGLALIKKTALACDAEGNRPRTPEETAAIDALTAEARTLRARITAARGDDTLSDELRRLGTPRQVVPASAQQTRQLSLGEQFLQSSAWDFLKAGGHRVGSAWRSPSAELFPPQWHAATLTSDPASGGAAIAPQYLPGIVTPPNVPLLLADLFAPGTTDSNVVTYIVETVFTNAAAPVAEGAVKPESTLTFAPRTDPVRKIAHWLPVTEEMLEDAPQMRSYIDARLRLGVLIEEQDQILNGTGIAPEIEGLLERDGLAADVVRVDPMTNADAMLVQTMAIYASSLFMPDAYVMNPANWAGTILQKNTAGDYYTGGPFSPIQAPTLWGLPVAVTPAVVAGKGVVGAFKLGGQVFRKGGIRVEASNSHADYFIKNLVAIRAEERLALAVYRPGAFGEVTGLTAGPVVTP